MRDLVRLREDVVYDIRRLRNRLSGFLLRHGRVFPGKAWTQAHARWLSAQDFGHEALASAFHHQLASLDVGLAQLASLDAELAMWATRDPFADAVARLSCLRGISTLSALTVACEVVDFDRFATPEEFAAFVGLVPSEHSSGGSERRGGITKTGNGHVRRVLVEASWHYRHRPGIGEKLAKRLEGQSPEVLAAAWAAQVRLCGRYRRLVGRGKASGVAAVAVARELARAIWIIMHVEHGLRAA